MTTAVCIFHVAVSAAYIWGAHEDIRMIGGPSLPIPGNYFSKLVWLTIIDLYIQILYHLYSAYLSASSKAKKSSATIYHTLSNTIVFPLALVVGIMFWGLYLADRDLIIPKGFADPLQVRPYFNHVLHTLPLLAMILDRKLWNHGRTPKLTAVTILSLVACVYIADIHLIHAISGFWPYGILNMLSPVLRMVFLFSSTLVLLASFMIGDALEAYWHPKNKKRRD